MANGEKDKSRFGGRLASLCVALSCFLKTVRPRKALLGDFYGKTRLTGSRCAGRRPGPWGPAAQTSGPLAAAARPLGCHPGKQNKNNT